MNRGSKSSARHSQRGTLALLVVLTLLLIGLGLRMVLSGPGAAEAAPWNGVLAAPDGRTGQSATDAAREVVHLTLPAEAHNPFHLDLPTGPAEPIEPVDPDLDLEPLHAEGLVLQSTMYSAQTHAAMINGRLYAIGDVIGELTIAEIRSALVVLTKDGQSVVLHMQKDDD